MPKSWAAILFSAATLFSISGVAQNNMTQVGAYDSLGYAMSVETDGAYAYVADQVLGLAILAISDTTNPTLIGMYRPPLRGFDISVRGNYAYLAAGVTEPYLGALYIIDISERSSPFLVGTYSTNWEIIAVDVDTFAYTSDYGGLKVLDISNPSQPTLVINFIVPGSALDIYKRGDYLYLATGTHGLQIIDVSSPSNPMIIGTCDTPGIALGVTMRNSRDNMNDYAYIADGDSGLQIIDVTDPANPFIAGNYLSSGAITDVSGGEHFVYAVVGNSSIEAIRVGYPPLPVRVGWSDIPSMSQGIDRLVVVGGESIYTFDQYFSTCSYLLGDINGNGQVNGIDVTYGVVYFKGGALPPLSCPCPPHGDLYITADVNGDCFFNGLDLLFMINYLRGENNELLPCSDCP